MLGAVNPDSLGATSMHEHLLLSLDCYFVMPEEASRRWLVDRPMSMDQLGNLPGRWNSHRDSMNMVDERIAVDEAMAWRLEGGGTIVDATSLGIARDPLALARISRASGIKIVMGAGYYVPASHPPNMDELDEGQIAARIIADVADGVGDTGVRAGIIGEIGCIHPPTENVLKVVRAAARAQAVTGAPILIHPGHGQSAPAEILSVLVGAGADPANVVMGHLDARISDRAVLRDLALAGTFLEFDTFGIEHGGYGGDPRAMPMPSDAGRIDLVEYLFDLGYGDRVVIAQDVCQRWRFERFGGTGYGHILTSIVPRMRARGLGRDDISAILVGNPSRALSVK